MTTQTVSPAGNAGWHWLMPAAAMAARADMGGAPGPEAMPARWACFPEIATPAPGLDPSLIRAARDFTVSTLQRWGVAERGEDVAVVVSELLTNALLHALPVAGQARTGWPIRLGLLQPERGVMCAVADPSRVAPVPQQPEHMGETGRGLHVIAALSDQWGCTVPTDMGKVMWATFSTRPAPPVPGPRSRSQAGAGRFCPGPKTVNTP
jgi:anti-sigma regulatory factor (Ser/Thr protein kinase)